MFLTSNSIENACKGNSIIVSQAVKMRHYPAANPQ